MADIEFDCPNCGQRLVHDEVYGGMTNECPACGASVLIPKRTTTNQPLVSPSLPQESNVVSDIPDDKPITLICPKCQAEFTGSGQLTEQESECPDCQQNVLLRRQLKLKSASITPDVIPPKPVDPAESATVNSKCPSCGVPIEQDTVICVNCGLDLRTGKKIQFSGTSAKANVGEARKFNKLPVFTVCIGLIIGVLLIVHYWSGSRRQQESQVSVSSPPTPATPPPTPAIPPPTPATPSSPGTNEVFESAEHSRASQLYAKYKELLQKGSFEEAASILDTNTLEILLVSRKTADHWKQQSGGPSNLVTVVIGFLCKECDGHDCQLCRATGVCSSCRGEGKCLKCDGKGGEKVVCKSCICKSCAGQGICSKCSGKGVLKCPGCEGNGIQVSQREGKCGECRGTGKVALKLGAGKRPCTRCKGTGVVISRTSTNCSKCNGRRQIDCDSCNGSKLCSTCGGRQRDSNCPSCSGTGVASVKCVQCNGTGTCRACGGSKHCSSCDGAGKCKSCRGLNLTVRCQLKVDPLWLSYTNGFLMYPITDFQYDESTSPGFPMRVMGVSPIVGIVDNPSGQPVRLNGRLVNRQSVKADLVCLVEPANYHLVAQAILKEELK